MLHSKLQNVCEISSGLGKLQQKHKENPSTVFTVEAEIPEALQDTAERLTQEQNQPMHNTYMNLPSCIV